jgi:dTDP-4-amino-4,6-dideoxygalactose transaminase
VCRARYQEELTNLPLTLPMPPAPDTLHARHLYTVLIHDDARVTRDEFLSKMHSRRIGTGVHYRALHTHPYYRERWAFRPEQFPNAWAIGEHTISLPLAPKLTDADVQRVIVGAREILG